MTGRLRPVVADLIGSTPREFELTPDKAALAVLAERMGVSSIEALTCSFTLSRSKSGTVKATGLLEAKVVQDDVVTMEPFTARVRESFALRFLPEDKLQDVLDPDDPEDEVGYTGSTLDLEEAMAQQLALALDPYPRCPE